jgi:hypothetical protein
MRPPSSSTRTGTVQPHSRIAAIWSTCARVCVRGLRASGTSEATLRRSTLSAGHAGPVAGAVFFFAPTRFPFRGEKILRVGGRPVAREGAGAKRKPPTPPRAPDAFQ